MNESIEEKINLVLLNQANMSGGLPNPGRLNYYLMKKERKIWIDFEINDCVMEDMRTILLWNLEDKGIPTEQRKPIWIYLYNFGGDVELMWALIDVITTSTTPVYTVNMGMSASAASLIFISGSKRFMMPNANILIHDGSATMSGEAIKVLDQSDNYRKDLKRCKNFILSHTKIPASALNKKRNNDWFLDAKYCLENGVCDKVVESIDEVL